MSEVVLDIAQENETQNQVPAEIQSILDSAESQRPKSDPSANTEEEDKSKKGQGEEEESPGKVVDKKEENTPPVVVPSNDDDISDEKLMEALKKRNINVPNIDALKPKEEEVDPKVEEEERKAKVRSWALQNKKVSTSLLDRFAVDSQKSKLDIAFEVYKNERKGDVDAEGEELTEPQLRTAFEDENFLYEPETDPKRKRAEKKLNFIADQYLHNTYKELNNIDTEYDSEIESQANKQNLSQAIEVVKNDFISKGMSFTIKDDTGEEVTINLPVNKSTINEISTQVSNMPILLSGNSNDDTHLLNKTLRAAILANNPEALFHEFATAYHSKKMLQYKAEGVGIQKRETGPDKVEQGEVSPEIQKILDDAKNRKG